jgi:aldose 1-epimerase
MALDPESGRTMTVYTTLPGIQFYTGNFVKEHLAKDGATYDKRGGFCLETQFYPNSLKHKNFPACFQGWRKLQTYYCICFGVSR